MVYTGINDLRSLSAKGQVAKTWIYWVSQGKQFRRAYKIPVNPQTPRQQSKRGFFFHYKQYWSELSDNEKSNYNKTAMSIKQGWQGENYFLQKWMKGEIVQECTRSIQRGKLLCNDGINNVTISPVVLAKSVVWVSTYAFGSSEGLAKSNGVKGAELTSTTNLAIEGIMGVSAPQPTAYWQVVEYY